MSTRARWIAAQYLVAGALAAVGWWLAQRFDAPLLESLADRGYLIEQPVFAWVLAVIPLLIIVRAHTLSDLPRVQQGLSVVLKAGVVAAIALSLVNPQKVETQPRKSSTVYLVDVSESVPDAMLVQARAAVEGTWRARGEHEVRLVVFAGAAREVPLPRSSVDADGEPIVFPDVPRLDDGGHAQATDVQQGLHQAFALLSDDHMPRIVLITDGLETRGSVSAEIATAKRFGIPIHYRDYTDVPRPGELMVINVEVPDNIKPNIPFVVAATARATQATAARCELLIDGVLAESQTVQIAVGDTPVTLSGKARNGGDKVLTLSCTAEQADADRFASNNRIDVPIKIPEKPRVLYIEGERRHRGNLLAALSRDFDVESRGARGIPASHADAAKYDLIFISDVPRIGEGGVPNMTSNQMAVLERYARSGGGLVFAGGENSFGPGGYTGTRLERKVLPVRLDVQRKQDMPGVALVLVIDRSGSMSGPKIQLAKEAALATLGVLQPSDKLGIVAFDSRPQDLVPLQRASNKYKISDRVEKLRPGGGTNILAAIDRGYQVLANTQAKVKHMILLTDGQSNPNGILNLVSASYQDKITISTVAVGMGADQQLLRRIAEDGRGRYYFTTDAKNIPKLFLKETSEVSRRALVEDRFRPVLSKRLRPKDLQMFKGLNMKRAPSLVGYVSTRAKSRTEVIMRSHLGEPILARWRLGLGYVVVWTSDVKNRWSHYWLSWPGYAKFWRQVIRAHLRVEKEDPSYAMVADIANGVLTVGVDAVDESDRFIDGITSDITVTAPSGEAVPLTLEQTAAGRYEGRLPLTEFGPYAIRGSHATVDDPDTSHRSFANITWPFPQEHLVGLPDLSTVAALAAATGGTVDPVDSVLFDVGDAQTEKRTPLWPYPLYAALALLLLDVLLRRVRLYGNTEIRWQDARSA